MRQNQTDRDSLIATLRPLVEEIVFSILNRPGAIKASSAGPSLKQDRPGKQSAADEKHGYTFGVDGLMSATEAADFLGGISRRTLYRLVAAGRIRKGKNKGKVVMCRRSVIGYVSSIEQ